MPTTTNQFQADVAPAELAPVVVDEAFADLPMLNVRIDAAQTSPLACNYAAETERLVAKIGEQMQALDNQRARLARLLSDLSTSCNR